MKKLIYLPLIALGLIIAITSCSKYDSGGTKARAEKNLVKTWKLQAYYLDGVDKTQSLLISNYTETYNDNGSYSRSYIDASGDQKNENGSWVLDNEKSTINISGIGSFELTNETSTVSASDYIILRLKKDELWYEFTNGGNTHEFRLVKN